MRRAWNWIRSITVWGSLSRRLLLLTLAFVMLAEVLIFVPSVSRFRKEYLLERLEKAQIASLAARAAPEGGLDSGLSHALLENAGAWSIAIKRGHSRALMLMRPYDGDVEEDFDLREAGPLTLIRDAVACLVGARPRFIRVIGDAARVDGEHIEIVLDEGPLNQAIRGYGLRILGLSMVISIITAGLVFLAVNAFLVRPMRRVIDGVISFREDPENPSRQFQPSGASGEIGVAERELERAQSEVREALRQKTRLAALGAAVAKINHDLRNILASAQLLADRLDGSADPVVRRVGPKLFASMDRAIRLCRQTLEFGRADEPPPQKARLRLAPMADDIAAALGLDRPASIVRFENRAAADHVVSADPDQLFRALLNLCRNAAQAMESDGGLLALELRVEDDRDLIDIVDTGPGLPAKALEKLFQPFQGSARRGGSGLGLAIAAELARAHGGMLSLIETGPGGSRFQLVLPRAAEPAPRHAERRAPADADVAETGTAQRPD